MPGSQDQCDHGVYTHNEAPAPKPCGREAGELKATREVRELGEAGKLRAGEVDEPRPPA